MKHASVQLNIFTPCSQGIYEYAVVVAVDSSAIIK
jgi:hypothetical protein